MTGCAGFIDSHLCEALLARGDAVVGWMRSPTITTVRSMNATFAPFRSRDDVELVEADSAVVAIDDLIVGCDGVFHLAAQPGVRGSFGGGSETSLRDAIAMFEGFSGRTLDIVSAPVATGDVRRTAADTSAASADLDWAQWQSRTGSASTSRGS